ncbi:NAD(+)--dinitrogen-reductase ADP-D-ribosyltransferase [Geobacter sp. DSM 9736]|uniref:NAD(+)--dinitrogen-reductase ADP-D-ribosyltransferase n=1 Tax=Geobacter sp. DSM 9736 TaxID=1277350 RepID=UPI000B513C82|nr:NAD(+)--dinitrogen-reductase ADP-D-ribosyltransferase [Geobacter sp. DSM 9736]SNB45180.1 NAD+---dinitrogen-reductase ADP-D-ribosyltransferase [Geobacter sp. DSM 9736]
MENSAFNHCNLPPWVIASRHFNENPHPLEIQGVRQANHFLFERLRTIASAEERAHIFNDYMSVKFQLHQWESQASSSARKSLRNSYLRFLRGWMMDSNSVEGAVLKGWVESRIGIPPTFHRIRIPSIHSEQYMIFAVDRTKGSARTSAINSQLDLLYEYCQYELARKLPEERHVRLFRGTNDADDYEVLEQVGRREQIVRLNNLVSFTSSEERAWEFGDTVWEIRAPLVKVFFFGGLLPQSILKGEEEFLVIGGEYRVRRIMC